MKNLSFSLAFCFSFFNAFSQPYNYEAKWKEIEKKEEKGEFKSNLNLINELLVQSRKDKQDAHTIKALFFQSNIFYETLEEKEEPEVAIVKNFTQEIAESIGVKKALLQNILGQMFYQYYNSKQWQIQNRTKVAGKVTDFREWTKRDFYEQIDSLYKSSIQDKNKLFEASFAEWKEIVSPKEINELKPTLYDMMLWNMSFFYQEDHFGLQDKEEALNKQWLNEKRYELAQMHRAKDNIAPSLNWRMASIEKNQSNVGELTQLAMEYPQEDFNAAIYAEIAKIYTATDKEKALKICRETIQKHPKSKWLQNIKEVEKSLLWPWATLKMEQMELPNQPIPILITHKNINKVFVRIYNLTETTETINKNYIGENNKKLQTNEKIERTQLYDLKEFKDYEEHKAIYKLDGLNAGNYAIAISNNEAFEADDDKNFVNYSEFQVSKILVLENESSENEENSKLLKLHFVDRKSGAPLANHTIDFYKFRTKITSQKTDNLGFLNIPYEKLSLNLNQYHDNQYWIYDQQYKEMINLGNKYFSHYYRQEPETKTNADIFLDRAIYRPTQTAYFKAIVYRKFKNTANILKKKTLKVKLINANYKEIASLDLTTNDFGSINGSFILPKDGVTGEFKIQIKDVNDEYGEISSKDFKVEEYKRPKFEVKMDEFKENYRLDQKISVYGQALAFSGAKITDAKVKYRIVREEQFFYERPWGFWKRSYGYYHRAPKTEEIEKGETKTDGKGNFTISYKTKTSEPRKELPRSYSYTLYVDVTDLNGETQSIESNFVAGDVPLKLSIEGGKTFSTQNWKKLRIRSENLNGQQVMTKGSLKIYQLIEPNRTIKPNPLGKDADYQSMDEFTFVQNFPFEMFDKNKQASENWERKLVLEVPFDTKISDTVSLNFKNLTAGKYIAEASTLYEKDTIMTSAEYEIKDEVTKRVLNHELLTVNKDKSFYEIGDLARVTFHSGMEKGMIYIGLSADNQWKDTKAIPLQNGTAIYEFPIKEGYNIGAYLNYYFVSENTMINQQENIAVFSKQNYDLKISTKTFRNKLLPGAKEIWEMTISGKDKEKVFAEVLATMYDASLDKFAKNDFDFNPFQYYIYNNLSFYQSNDINRKIDYLNHVSRYPQNYYLSFISEKHNQINFFGFKFGENYRRDRMMYKSMAMAAAPFNHIENVKLVEEVVDSKATIQFTPPKLVEIINEKTKAVKNVNLSQVKIRTNLNETAFFFPNLMTDAEGNVKIQFTSPEALTKWKFQLLAHTKELEYGLFKTEVQTQKDLMVVPNAPRFLREGDHLTFSSKISNVSDKNLTGEVELQWFDAFTMKPIDSAFGNINARKTFEVKAGENTNIDWQISIPYTHQAVVYRVVAKSGNFSDGEENTLPILTNRMLVTETLPISVRENQSKTFVLEKLKNNNSSTLQNFNLTMELTTNPLWTVIGALPYLREYPYECSEQLFSRLYGNAISTAVLNQSPKIKKVFDDWNQKGLQISNLEKNQELKALLLEETPWLRDAQSETEQMQRIALFFDLNFMQMELQQAKEKLLKRQQPSGAFAWFEGGREDVYITNHIIGGFGKLQKMLGANSANLLGDDIQSLVAKAIAYSDASMLSEWNRTKKKDRPTMYYLMLHYFYVRSFWKENNPMPASYRSIQNEVFNEMLQEESKSGLSYRAMLALTLNRFGRTKEASKIVHAINERSVESDEIGKYWKDNVSGWYWYQAPIETQTMLIEAYDEIIKDEKSVESMKVWLIKNKQNNRWSSTKATTEAVYALFSLGKSWLNAEEGITVKAGNENVYPPKNANEPSEINASGYFKKSWKGADIQPSLATIQVDKKSPGVMYGGLFWQYFEQLDKITPAQSNLKIKKELYLKTYTDKGVQLQPITESTPIKVGDLVTVRCVLQSDRDLSYIHLKDMRASGFEPVNVFSSYKWKDGLGYYESTRDASTNFFISFMQPGVYVFEYDVKANNAGTFSNGITTIQNMYAPEFSAHTQGIKVQIQR
jgi:uncharacterized protein YfaS (alpha-2-macroglobulin family)